MYYLYNIRKETKSEITECCLGYFFTTYLCLQLVYLDLVRGRGEVDGELAGVPHPALGGAQPHLHLLRWP